MANKGLKAKGETDLTKSLFSVKEEADKSVYTKQKLDTISKGLTAQYGVDPSTQIDGGALRPESLDQDIKQVTYGSQDFTIYNDLVRVPANNTVEKYIVYYDHGRAGHERFQAEIGIGRQTNPHLKQKTVNMKYLSAASETSMVLAAANTVEDPIAVQELGAINVLAKTIEWAIFYGDSDLTKGEPGSGLQFDGISKLIDPGNVVNWHGKNLTPALLNQAAVMIGKKGYGVATDAYMPIGVKADFVNKYLGAQRVLIPTANGDLTAGFNIAAFNSARGTIRLNGSTIMDLDNELDESKLPVQGAPLAPTVTAEVVTDANGEFLADDLKEDDRVVVPKEVGTELEYRVVASGTAGDSQPSDIVKATPANATDGIKLSIKLDKFSVEAPDYVAIYRKSLIAGHEDTFYLVGKVAMNKMSADGTIEFTDVNDTIAGTTDVFVMERTPEVIRLFEFTPMTKLQLAIVTNAIPFAILWQGALQLGYPKRVVRIKNVRYADGTDELKF